MGMPVNHELTLTEVRVKDVYDVVDVFVISEGNVSAGGQSKPLTFFNEFQKGFMEPYQVSVLYINELIISKLILRIRFSTCFIIGASPKEPLKAVGRLMNIRGR